MDDRDYSYFHRRAAEERAAAEQSSNPAAQVVHLRLADRYETLLGQTTDKANRSTERNGVAVPHLFPVPPARTL